jgi:hypothetical protein
MERSLLSAFAGTLLGISTLELLLCMGWIRSPGATPNWKAIKPLDPITYENISIFLS